MKLKASVFIATSLDGMIARTDGNLDWLDAASATVPPGEDCGYRAFMETVDVLVMGRKTFDKVLSFGEWPYGEMPVVVLSSHPIKFSDRLPSTVTHSSEEPAKLCGRLEEEGVRHIYVDGGLTVQRFLVAGLIDEVIITLIPVLLGEGTPLFGSLTEDIPLRCLGSKAFDFGFVQVHYAVERLEASSSLAQ